MEGWAIGLMWGLCSVCVALLLQGSEHGCLSWWMLCVLAAYPPLAAHLLLLLSLSGDLTDQRFHLRSSFRSCLFGLFSVLLRFHLLPRFFIALPSFTSFSLALLFSLPVLWLAGYLCAPIIAWLALPLSCLRSLSLTILLSAALCPSHIFPNLNLWSVGIIGLWITVLSDTQHKVWDGLKKTHRGWRLILLNWSYIVLIFLFIKHNNSTYTSNHRCFFLKSKLRSFFRREIDCIFLQYLLSNKMFILLLIFSDVI